MTQAEIKEMETIRKTLDTLPPCKEWDDAYDRYCELCAKEQEEYKRENIDNLKKFYDVYIANREWKDIDPEAWDWYSDYHKDVFGYRPKTLNFGE